MASYIDELIMFGVGLWMACLGFGLVSAPARLQGAYLRFFKWGGPALIFIALALAAEKTLVP